MSYAQVVARRRYPTRPSWRDIAGAWLLVAGGVVALSLGPVIEAAIR